MGHVDYNREMRWKKEVSISISWAVGPRGHAVEPAPLPVQFLQGGAPHWHYVAHVRMLGSESLPSKRSRRGEKVDEC